MNSAIVAGGLIVAAVASVSVEAQIRQARADGIRPETQLTVSAWADAHRRLPKKSSAEPGPWRTARTPYLREIMDCMSTTSDVEEVVFMKPAQVGGTEAILNVMGYVIDHAPGPMIVIQPTDGLAKRFSRQRVDPLIRITPRISSKVSESRERDSGNTMLSKEYPGGQLVLTGANSAVGLRSMPAQYAFMDEVDGYPVDVDEEGSPIALVEARQRTFARRKRMKVSTPTIDGRSAIQSAFEGSDQRRYYVPCPDCGEMQPLVFAQLTWSKLGRPPEQAVYECRACFYQIQEHQKTVMLAAGEWRAEKPERTGKVRGYHLNALYAPVGWMSWGEIARQFVAGHRDPERFRVFVNTVLGEAWTAKGEAPAWEGLQRRREAYAIGTVPQEVVFLTAGVDVQKDRVVYEVVGWGRGKRSWSIDYGELPGDTADLDDGPWGQVDELLERAYPHAGGGTMAIRMLAVDSGYNTQTVYGWARRYPLNRVAAVKGQDHGGLLVGSPTPVEVTDRGRKLKRGGRLWPVSVNIVKSELYGWLRLEAPTDAAVAAPPGFCRFPQYPDEYFRQLTAEQLVAHKTRRGFIRMEWELIPGRQNHVLDARVYARAAAYLAGLDRLTDADWTVRERFLQPPTAEPPPVPPPAPAAPESNKRAGWLKPRHTRWLKKGDRKMTCIVGFVEGHDVWMGGDSAGVAGLDLVVRTDGKVFHNGPMLFGITTSFRMGQLIRYALTIPAHNQRIPIEKFLTTTFIDGLRECLKSNGWATKNLEHETGGTFLVGYMGQLFTIYDDYQVEISANGFAAIGCGGSIASGALFATPRMRGRQRIKMALRAAERFSAGVRGPFTIKKLRGKT